MSVILELDKVNFSYSKNISPDPGKSFYFRDINAEISEGDYISVIGKNGSGKSTLVKLISRILTGYSGNILFKGKDIQSIGRKEYSRSVSYLPQTSASLNSDFLVEEFLLLGRYSSRKFSDFSYSDEDRDIVSASIAETGTEKLAVKYIYELSGGERQKVLLTLGLVQLNISGDLKEKILIIDEPLTYLDVSYQMEIFGILKKLNERGLTIIIVIHDLALALNYSGKSILMNEGRMIKYSDSGNVITEAILSEYFQVNSRIVSHENNLLINYTSQNNY